VLVYSRDIAFATAQIYAQAAEERGAWDARLEALVVDALLRGEVDDFVRSRASALGWAASEQVLVVVGHTPQASPEVVIDDIRRTARSVHLDVLTGVQGDRLVAVLGGVEEPLTTARHLIGQFGPGAVVVGPLVPDLTAADRSAQEALAGWLAAPAWPDAPRPVLAEDLLAERALGGDPVARGRLVDAVYRPLEDSGTALLETAAAFLERAPSLEAAARLLFVHPNTVRYRLRRVTDLTGYCPTDSRDAFSLRVALALGRLAGPRQARDTS
jgi:sugar diacid utilization regulator